MSESIYNSYSSSRKYIRWYLSLIKNTNNRILTGYTERHHVFPISIFGKNRFIVKLTAREHFIAHKLLHKIYLLRYGANHKNTMNMLRAISFMATRDEIKQNSRMYEECRKAASILMSGENNPSIKYGFTEEHRSKLSKAGKGRPHTEAHKQNLKLASKKRFEKYGRFFNEDAWQKSLGVRLKNSKRFNYSNETLGLVEYDITAAAMVNKYPEMNLSASNLRKLVGKNKNGTPKKHKGWIIVE